MGQEEARLLKHNYIGSEHLLLGLLREGQGVAAEVLETLGLTLETVRAEVVRLVGLGTEVAGGQIPFTPRAKAALEHSLRESTALGHGYIGTEHLLLGLVANSESVANRVFVEFDVHPEQVRDEVLRLLTESPAPTARQPPPGLAEEDEEAREETNQPALDEEEQPAPAQFSEVEAVPTHEDRPATQDSLGRARLAEVLANRLRAQGDSPTALGQDRESFLIHIHARWGEGKSSFLNFLRRYLTSEPDPWVVIPFNAWEHQRLAPPWWWLMAAIHRHGRKALWKLDKRRYFAFWLRDVAWRLWNLRSAWVPVMLATALLVVSVDSGLFSGSLSATGKAATAVSAVAALAVTVWGVARGLSQWLLVGSAPVGARFLPRVRDPLGVLKRRFNRLVAWLGHPIIVFIDDIDRCQAEYVVSLLEGVQTLFVNQPVTYVVSGDRAWVSESYAKVYGDFTRVAPEPARPLGHLFIEKTFQIALDLPPISPMAQQRYWGQLLRSSMGQDAEAAPATTARSRADAREQLRGLKTAKEIERAITAAPSDPDLREALLEAASQRLASPEFEQELSHFLEPFAPLVESNPRAMKRLINAHGLERARQIREGVLLNEAQRKQHVLWTILKLRWPLLAEHFTETPEDRDRVVAQSVKPDEELLWSVVSDRRLIAVLTGAETGVALNVPAIKMFAGVGPSAAAVGA